MSRCVADGASGARFRAVQGGQHGLRPHPADVHGETPGGGEGVEKSSVCRVFSDPFVCL